MPTPETVDIEALIAPIPGDDPSGGTVPFALRERLDLARKEVNPDDYDPGDPMRPTELKRPDWPGIAEMAGEGLVETSKDLMLAARLTEALTKLHGFAGLRDGLRLIRRLLDEAWDRLRPTIEDPEDLEARAAPLVWLDDSDRGARFPSTIRAARLIEGPAGAVSWLDWNLSQSNRASVPAEEVERLVAAAPREHCRRVADELEEALGELQLLLGVADERLGPAAPSFGQLRQAALECRTLAQQVLARKGSAPVTDEEGEARGGSGSEGVAVPGASNISRTITSRAQAYQRLIEVADALEALEPQSPIPYVIRRAVALGQLPFPALMKELISDSTVLGDLSRNLGIRELAE
jgi:type VI secretion system protein ImpA